MNLDSTDVEEVNLDSGLVQAGAGSTVATESCGFEEGVKLGFLEVKEEDSGEERLKEEKRKVEEK